LTRRKRDTFWTSLVWHCYISTMNSIIELTPQQLRRAANLKEKLASLQKELGRILGIPAQTPNGAAPRTKKRRKMSAAGRARMAASAKARWAKARAAGKKTL